MAAGLGILVIYGGWIATLLWGSIMAVRGAKNWTTILQVIGTGGMLTGAVFYALGAMFAFSSFSNAMSSGPGSTPAFESMWIVIIAIAAILFLLGVLLFTAGYVGMCVRYGATERRARELEGLVGQLQQRFGSES